MKSITIIGTAGRGDDAPRLTADRFQRMEAEALRVAAKLAGGQPWMVCSGGAAFADHIAVRLFLAGHAERLFLALPAALNPDGSMVDNGGADFRSNPGGRTNLLHRRFQEVTGINSFAEIAKAIRQPRCTHQVYDGFFARNRALAEFENCVALTFGQRAMLKDGGTGYTMKKFLTRLDHERGASVHIDLNEMAAFSPARV